MNKFIIPTSPNSSLSVAACCLTLIIYIILKYWAPADIGGYSNDHIQLTLIPTLVCIISINLYMQLIKLEKRQLELTTLLNNVHRHMLIPQEALDNKLSELALQYVEISKSSALKRLVGETKSRYSDAACAYAEFSDAVKAAKKIGYNTKVSVGEYLPESKKPVSDKTEPI